jgi:import inner membrane translocase subunit TIM54
MIFLTVVGSFGGALIYDRRRKKLAQRKWSNLVAHLSKETLPVEQTRRKLTVFLAAPPGDGLRVAREHFQEYVKPILVSAALDYEVIEGRREGEIRAGLAENIRKFRRRAGEASNLVVEEDSTESAIAETRRRMGVYEEPGPKGDLVIGRHAWKEYIRGFHEGWLGPLDPPSPASPEQISSGERAMTPALDGSNSGSSTDSAADAERKDPNATEKDETPKEPPKSRRPTPPFVTPAQYPSRSIPATLPSTFEGSSPIPFPHILGFLNTPIRLYRFLTQRYLADSVGHDVAALVLASLTRPYGDGSSSTHSDVNSFDATSSDGLPASSGSYEQQGILEHEEKEWRKSTWKQIDGEENYKEREWLDDIVVDPRLASRMRRFILAPEEEIRAERIAQGQEWVLGEEKPRRSPFWKQMWIKYGHGEDENAAKTRSIIGNLDDEEVSR